MDLPVFPITTAPESSVTSTRTDTSHKSVAPPPAALVKSLFESTYSIIPQEFNRYLYPREELTVATTCKTFYDLYQKNILPVMSLVAPSWLDSINPFAPKITTDILIQCTSESHSERFTSAYIVANANQQFLEKHKFNFGPYTRQLIIEGEISLAEAKKLDEFINLYKSEKFDNEDARSHWLNNKVNSDALLCNYFSPGYLYWPKYASQIDSDTKPFNLELALLMSSKGVQKYIPSEKLEEFYDDIIDISNERDDPPKVFKSILMALNNEVFQAYLNEGKASLDYEALEMYFGGSYYQGRKEPENYLMNPMVKQYFDEGIVGSLMELVDMSHAGLNMLCSPIVREAYENGEYTLKQLRDVIAKFPDQNYGAENRLLHFFSEGHWKYNLIASMTKEQIRYLGNEHDREYSLVKNITQEQLNRFDQYKTLIDKDELKFSDVVSSSLKFKWYVLNH